MTDFFAHWAFMMFMVAVIAIILGVPLWAAAKVCDMVGSETPMAVVLVVGFLFMTALLARDFQKFQRAEQRAETSVRMGR